MNVYLVMVALTTFAVCFLIWLILFESAIMDADFRKNYKRLFRLTAGVCFILLFATYGMMIKQIQKQPSESKILVGR